eukprot:6874605-Pyramimonas_sp.AAC.1
MGDARATVGPLKKEPCSLGRGSVFHNCVTASFRLSVDFYGESQGSTCGSMVPPSLSGGPRDS